MCSGRPACVLASRRRFRSRAAPRRTAPAGRQNGSQQPGLPASSPYPASPSLRGSRGGRLPNHVSAGTAVTTQVRGLRGRIGEKFKGVALQTACLAHLRPPRPTPLAVPACRCTDKRRRPPSGPRVRVPDSHLLHTPSQQTSGSGRTSAMDWPAGQEDPEWSPDSPPSSARRSSGGASAAHLQAQRSFRSASAPLHRLAEAVPSDEPMFCQVRAPPQQPAGGGHVHLPA